MGEVLEEYCEKSEEAYWIRNEVQYSIFVEQENDFIRFQPDFLLFVPISPGEFKQVLIETKGEHIQDFHNNPQKEEFLQSLDKELNGERVKKVSGFYFISDEVPDKAEIKEKLVKVL